MLKRSTVKKVLTEDLVSHPDASTQNDVNVVFTGYTVSIRFNGTTGDEVVDRVDSCD